MRKYGWRCQLERLVFFDTNAIDLLASNRIDVIEALRGTQFIPSYTPDLEHEYNRALQHDNVKAKPAVSEAIRSILDQGQLRTFFGFDGPPYAGFDQGMWASEEVCNIIGSLPDYADADGRPGKRTDLHLVLLAIDHIVVTNNHKERIWRRYPTKRGTVIQWSELGELLSKGRSLSEAIEEIVAGRQSTAP